MIEYNYGPTKVVLWHHEDCVGVLHFYSHGASFPKKDEQIQIGDKIYFVDNVRHIIGDSSSVIHLFVSKIN